MRGGACGVGGAWAAHNDVVKEAREGAVELF